MLFAQSEELDRAFKSVWEYAKKLQRGDTLSHQAIEQLGSCERYTSYWKSLIGKIRRVYRKQLGIVIRPLNGTGYRLCTITEQLQYVPRNRQRRALRQVGRGVQELRCIGGEELSIRQQMVRAKDVESMSAERKRILRGLREHNEEFRKSETVRQAAGVA